MQDNSLASGRSVASWTTVLLHEFAIDIGNRPAGRGGGRPRQETRR
jgi:hypothetical protein